MSLIGQTIGNYKVVQQIGEGGMGVVYLAEHPVIGRKVAIKLLHTSFTNDPETVARFFNEARAIHMIRHDNIVEILDFGQTGDRRPYFIMEFLVGESLADRIARGPVPPAQAVEIASQICDALQAAHDKNIIHRDLKPHNVFLVGPATRPEVKILDFGVAKMTTGWGDATESGGQSVKTRTGSLMGTPLYMSPEQCRGSGKLDHRTDVYSLAVILFEMISGRPPFTAEGIGELFAKHMLEPAPSLAAFAPDTPPHIVAAVARALSKDLEDRFPDMKSMRAALNAEPEPAAHVAPSLASGAAGGPRPPAVSVPAAAVGVPASAGRTMAGAQATTLSSSVSELDDSLDALGGISRGRRTVLIAGAVAAAALAGVLILVARGSSSPTPSAIGTDRDRAEKSAAPRGATGPAAAPAPAPPAPATTVHLRFEAEPRLTHVFKASGDPAHPEDLGAVPVELSLSRASGPVEYLLRAEGHKERVVRVDATQDRSLHFALERLPAIERRAKSPERKPATRPQRRPALHDADGLAVPSF